MSERIYCSEIARTQAQPLFGSAVQVDLWLLLEYPRPWKPKALEDNDLPAPVQVTLDRLSQQLAAEAGLNLRIQFIKQSGSGDRQSPTLFVADCRQGHERLIRAELPDFAAIADLTATDILQAQWSGARQVNEEIYLVCTNGQRDVCCARFGLPVFESLRMSYDKRVWQTTHLGGHRFAPNVLCLPSGVVYGFVAPNDSVDLVAAHDQGLIDVSRLRGRSCLHPAVQAAEYFWRQEFGVKSLKGGRSELQSVEGESYRVRCGELSLADVRLRQQAWDAPVLASCGAAEKTVKTYVLDDIEVIT